MPVQVRYPGVYIEEIPSGVRTITGVATSITAFIGRALRGPANEATPITSYADFERQFGGLWNESTLGHAVGDFYLNGGSQAIIVRLHRNAASATLSLPTGGTAPDDTLPLEASSPGSWGKELSATIDYDTKDPNDPKLFNLIISEEKGATEKFLNVSIDHGNARYLPRVLQERSNLVRVSKDDQGKWRVPNVKPQVPITPIKAQSGTDGDALTQAEFVGTGMQASKQGLYALEQADLFNILCIPPYDTGDVDPAILKEAAKYCHDRRAILLVDPPSSWTNKKAAQTGIASVPGIDYENAKNTALFFPSIRKANPLHEGQIEEFVPCGTVAGIFARTDAQRGVWKAPAGLEASLTGVLELTVPLTDTENGDLNPLGINCLRTFSGVGSVVWGARTLQGNDRFGSEWKYIPVRRTALFIEESLYRGTQWVVFEPNDEPLWSQIRLNIGAFMHNLFRQGAFQGRTPREAYFVKCDKETTTQNDIDLGIVNIVVGFAPLKPAEFVIIQIQQIAGQIQV